MRFATTRHTIATSCAPPLFHLFPSCGAVFDKRRRFQHDIAHTLLASPFSYIEAIPASIPASLYTCLPFFRYVGTGPLLNGPNTLCGSKSHSGKALAAQKWQPRRPTFETTNANIYTDDIDSWLSHTHPHT